MAKSKECSERTCIQVTSIALINQSMERMEEKIDKLLEEFNNLDNKFASKQVEKIVYYLLAILFTSMFSTIIYFIFNHVGLSGGNN